MELARAAGVVRDCYAPMAGIPVTVPIWFTENGVPTGANSEVQQAAARTQLVRAARDSSGTFNISDYRWFDLRDSSSSGPQTLVGPTFSSDGLLRDDYSAKPSFAAYRGLIASLGASASAGPRPAAGRRRGARGRGRRSSRRAGTRPRRSKHRSAPRSMSAPAFTG